MVKVISRYAIYECFSLLNIKISNSNEIMQYSFYASGFLNITNPSSVIYFDTRTFNSCLNLKFIEVDNKNNFKNDGILNMKDLSRIICYPGGKENETFEIQNNFKSVGACAFYDGNTKLNTIIIPDSVTLIKHALSVTNIKIIAFSGCDNLEEVNISENIGSNGENGFCSSS